jgi:hypothetical protein
LGNQTDSVIELWCQAKHFGERISFEVSTKAFSSK